LHKLAKNNKKTSLLKLTFPKQAKKRHLTLLETKTKPEQANKQKQLKQEIPLPIKIILIN
jgi:hypothetical protein